MDDSSVGKIDCLHRECPRWVPDKSPHCGEVHAGNPGLPDDCAVMAWLSEMKREQEERHQKDMDERDHMLGYFENVTPSFLEMTELLWDIVKGKAYNLCTCPPDVKGHEPWCMILRIIGVTERALVARDCVRNAKLEDEKDGGPKPGS
jgi:hypothetical protein